MSADESGLLRYPCAWCDLPAAWPDGCSELPDAPGDARYCITDIEHHCMDGDHRRCAVGKCTISSRWHDEIRDAAVLATHTAGHAWAIVSIIPDEVYVAGTTDQLDHAEQMLRTVLRHAGRDPDEPEGRGLVYIVRGADGGFL